MDEHQVYLGFGSNVGDKLFNIFEALRLLSLQQNITLNKLSSIYETKPVGYSEQDDFLNMVASLKTTLSPFELHNYTKEIEQKLHRIRTVRYGPRTIDIDILLFDELKLNQEELTIPHPRITERAFVLVPLLEIIDKEKFPFLYQKYQDSFLKIPEPYGVKKLTMNLTFKKGNNE